MGYMGQCKKCRKMVDGSLQIKECPHTLIHDELAALRKKVVTIEEALYVAGSAHRRCGFCGGEAMRGVDCPNGCDLQQTIDDLRKKVAQLEVVISEAGGMECEWCGEHFVSDKDTVGEIGNSPGLGLWICSTCLEKSDRKFRRHTRKKKKTLREIIDGARAAGHDSLGVAYDLESLGALRKLAITRGNMEAASLISEQISIVLSGSTSRLATAPGLNPDEP